MSHALLSPSSASRWINCPPSALLNAEAGDRDTVFTREGTLAHAVAELKARKHFIGMGPQKYGAALKKLKKSSASSLKHSSMVYLRTAALHSVLTEL